ncbi:MAG: ankyrin repeat domain-containing protein [Bacteroidota bacterium]
MHKPLCFLVCLGIMPLLAQEDSLFLALTQANLSQVNELIAKTNLADRAPTQAPNYLQQALYSGQPEIVKLVLDANHRDLGTYFPVGGDYPNTGSYLLGPLVYGKRDVLSLLIVHGANLNDPMEDGQPVFVSAAFQDHPEWVEELRDLGADISAKPGQSDFPYLLTESVTQGDSTLLKHMVKAYEWTFEGKDQQGRGLLAYARHPNMVAFLIARGVRLKDPRNPSRLLLQKVWALPLPYIEAYAEEKIIHKKALFQLSAVDKKSFWQGPEKRSQYLLEQADRRSQRFASPLAVTAQEGWKTIPAPIRLAVAQRCDSLEKTFPPFADPASLEPLQPGGHTLLHEACRLGDVELVRYLLETRKVKATVTDPQGNTLLHYAALGQSKVLVNYLLKKTELTLKTKNRKLYTPKMLAFRYGYTKMGKYLESRE